MSREYPDLLNPSKAADGQRSFQGTMPLNRMRRLAPMLAAEGVSAEQAAPEQAPGSRTGHCEPEAVVWKDAWFRADFARDAQGFVTVELWVEAELPLVCQRSLLPYLEPVRRHSLLGVVENAADQELLPAHYEPVLVDQGQLALLELVEDELLLGLPQVPRNPAIAEVVRSTDAAAGQSAEPEERVRKPFEKLASLLRTAEKENLN